MSTFGPDSLLSREEAAKYTGFSLNYLNNEASAGLFAKPHKKIGQVCLYRRRDLDVWRDDRVKNGRPRAVYVTRQRG